jgi:hypothetical protein
MTIIFAVSISVPIIAQAITEPFTVNRNTRSKVDDFDYEFWIQNRGEDAVMTLTGGGTFECEWNGVFNVLFRIATVLLVGGATTYILLQKNKQEENDE